MKFRDTGIIISQKKYGEKSLIVKLFSQNHGIYRGFVKNSTSKKNQAIFQIGNLISFEWSARNEEALGSFHYCEVEKSYASKIMFERLKLNCLTSLLSIFDSCFLERENHRELFDKFHGFLQEVSGHNSPKQEFLASYIRLELEILSDLGYGVDLTSCAVSEVETDLGFVSPKSARAVCRKVAKPYEDKLLRLPEFLLKSDNDNFKDGEISDGLKLSGYFLEKFIFSQHNSCQRSRKKIIEEAT